jgi:hypothetical protein
VQQAPPSKQQQRDALLNQLPPAMRQVFWGYYQARLAEAVAQAEAQASNTGLGGADPYQVEHLVQETLIREAEGRDDPDGLGDVPETAHKVVGIIIPVNDPRSRQQRSASAASGAAAGELSRGRKLGVLALLGALLLMGVWWVWPSASTETGIQAQASPSPRGSASATPSSAAQRTSATPITEVSGGAVQVSDPTSLEFPQERAESTIFTVVASTGERGGPWQPVVDPGTAAWLQGTYINSVFCLPPDAEELLAAAERGQRILLRLANTAVRKYEVVRVRNVGRQQTEVIE